MSYLRITGAVVGVCLLAFLWWRVSLSFSQGDELEHRQQEIDRLYESRVRDTRIATAIDTFRGQQFDFAKNFRNDLAKLPLTLKVAPHVDPNTGAIEPCVVRDAVRYHGLYNQAVTGTDGVP